MASVQEQVIAPFTVESPPTNSQLSQKIKSFLASRQVFEPINAEPSSEPESSSSDDSSIESSSPVRSLLTEQIEAYRKAQAACESDHALSFTEDSLPLATPSPEDNPYRMFTHNDRSPPIAIKPQNDFFRYR